MLVGFKLVLPVVHNVGRSRGLLVECTPSFHSVFVSHQWLGKHHPDEKGSRLPALSMSAFCSSTHASCLLPVPSATPSEAEKKMMTTMTTMMMVTAKTMTARVHYSRFEEGGAEEDVDRNNHQLIGLSCHSLWCQMQRRQHHRLGCSLSRL